MRLPIPYAFALMSRLHPQVSAFTVLKTTEGLEYIPAALSFVTAVTCALLRLPPVHFFLAVLITESAGLIVNQLGFYSLPGLVAFGTAYSYLAGWGVLLVVAVVATFVTIGWTGVLAFFAAKLLAWLVSQVLQWSFARKSARMGRALTFSERHFVNAYRLHAVRLGLSTDVGLGPSEENEDSWRPAFDRLASEWPQVVARFTP